MTWTVDRTFGCWLWTGRTDSRDGRPLMWRSNTPQQAHIVVYEQNVGLVPSGTVLDHNCNVKLCVAPHHLEPVTQRENQFRKSFRYRARITHCKNGHDMATNAVVMPETAGRVCRQCNRDAMRPGEIV